MLTLVQVTDADISLSLERRKDPKSTIVTCNPVAIALRRALWSQLHPTGRTLLCSNSTVYVGAGSWPLPSVAREWQESVDWTRPQATMGPPFEFEVDIDLSEEVRC